MEREMNWVLIIVGILLMLSPFGYTISAAFKMTIKGRALLLGGLVTCSILGALLIGYATEILPVDLSNLICIGSLLGIIIFLTTASLYWKMRWYRRRYLQQEEPNLFTSLFEQMYNIEDKNNANE